MDLGLSSNQITKDGDGGTDSFTNAKGGTIEIGGSLFADNLTGARTVTGSGLMAETM